MIGVICEESPDFSKPQFLGKKKWGQIQGCNCKNQSLEKCWTSGGHTIIISQSPGGHGVFSAKNVLGKWCMTCSRDEVCERVGHP